MKEEIKIDKGIPFVRKRPDSKYKKIVDNIEVGDSVLVPDMSVARSLRIVMIKRFGAKCASMQTQSDGQVRVWRLK